MAELRPRIKVAHITTIDLSLRYLLLNQLLSIQAAGYEVVGVSTPGPYVKELQQSGIRHIPLSMTRRFTPFADLRSLVQLVRMMRRERFTIVHTHNPKPGLLGQLAARIARVPVVVNTLHGFYFHDQMTPQWRKFYIMTEKIAARCSDVILSQNREDIQTAIGEGICLPDRIKWLGNGIDLQWFHPTNVAQQTLEEKRHEIGLTKDGPVIGFVGRLVAEKGILELVEAAQIALRSRPDLQFLVVGPIDAEKEDSITPNIASQYGVSESFIFTGMRQDMPEMYALMDVFVLPSHREGFPRAPMEAAAMGVPTIVTDIRGCREAVAANENGLLVPVKDSKALASSILRMVTDVEYARQLGARGREIATQRFDEQAVFARVKAEYARLLAKLDFYV